jgi:hypothetical protein
MSASECLFIKDMSRVLLEKLCTTLFFPITPSPFEVGRCRTFKFLDLLSQSYFLVNLMISVLFEMEMGNPPLESVLHSFYNSVIWKILLF